MNNIKPYTKYKPSGIAWLGDIPAHWEVKSVRKSFLFSVGFTPPTGKDEYFTYSGNGVPWITIRDMKRKYIEHSKQDISFLYKETFKKPLISKGSLLYSFKLSVGKVAFAKNDLFTNEAIFSVLPNENYCLNFFFYSLPNQILKNASENIYGAKILNQELIKSAKIIFPPLSEQTAIANFLDYKTAKIDRFIQKKKQLIKLLNEQKAGIINDAVTKGLNPNAKMKPSGIEWLGDIPGHWEVRKLKYVINDKLKYGANEPGGDLQSNDPRYIRITDFNKSGTLRNDTFCSLKSELAKPYLLKEGDILFARSGGTVGKTFQFKNYNGVACYAGYLIKAEPNINVILSDFLFQFTNSGIYEIWKNFIFNKATIENIGADKYCNLPVIIPPIPEQTAIVSHIEKETTIINKTIATIEKEIALVQEYRTALIAEAVTGKIDVSDYEIPKILEADIYEAEEEEEEMENEETNNQ